ncbi:MAG: hypothetical protein ACI4DZ_08045 [Oliverpabstia sp.]
MAENEKHQKEIQKLKQAAKRTSDWADKNERTKIGFNPIKEHDRFLDSKYQGLSLSICRFRSSGF